VIGFVDGGGKSTPVRSPFRGFLMGLLAHAGERVREGQPVAWLTTA
jgi:biotin carboxyl carrier protein